MRIFIETYGCSANQAESEIVGGLLAKAGHDLVNTMEGSDLVVINTCFVKTPTEQKIMHRISEIVKGQPGKKLVIAGCMPEVMGRRLRSIAPDASMVSTHNITRIAEAAERVAGGERVMLVGKTDEKKLCRPRARKNRLVVAAAVPLLIRTIRILTAPSDTANISQPSASENSTVHSTR